MGNLEEMDQNHSMRLLREQLAIMQKQGHFRMIPLDVLTHFISGGLNEAALWLANESAQPKALDETMEVLSVFLEGFKQNTIHSPVRREPAYGSEIGEREIASLATIRFRVRFSLVSPHRPKI